MRVFFWRIVVLFSVFIISINVAGINKAEQVLKRKVDFIVHVSSMVSLPNTINSEVYKIGIYGKGPEINSLLKEFKSRGEKLTINGKRVELFKFKRARHIKPVDLIYVSGNSKLRVSDLTKKLDKHPFVMLTENFPFGTSMLNFIVNEENEIYFELHEELLHAKGAQVNPTLLNASNRIPTEENWLQILDNVVTVINNQSETIEEKSHELEETKKVILELQIIIFAIVLILIVISGLVYALLKINKQRKDALKNLYDSIDYATYIQKSIVPSNSLFKKNFEEYFILFKPKSIVSGDFYWLNIVEDDIYFAVADCTGHGIPGAMLSIMCHQTLTWAVKEIKDPMPSSILIRVSDYIEDYFSESKYHINNGMDIALCKVNLKRKELTYAGAKCPMYLVKDNELKVIKADRYSIGDSIKAKQFTDHSFSFSKEDSIYLFSDGYPDQFGGPRDKKYSYKRFREVLVSIKGKSMMDQKDILNNHIEEWMGKSEQTDDITVLGLKF